VSTFVGPGMREIHVKTLDADDQRQTQPFNREEDYLILRFYLCCNATPYMPASIFIPNPDSLTSHRATLISTTTCHPNDKPPKIRALHRSRQATRQFTDTGDTAFKWSAEDKAGVKCCRGFVQYKTEVHCATGCMINRHSSTRTSNQSSNYIFGKSKRRRSSCSPILLISSSIGLEALSKQVDNKEAIRNSTCL
jgi:hypothetical protein